MFESSLYTAIESHMKQNGYVVLQEFPVGKWSPKRVDLIGIKPGLNELVCIEVKLKNFCRVLDQAYYRLFFSDYVYIAFPHKYAMYVAERYEETFRKYGLGLMAVKERVEILITPQKSAILNEDYKRYLIKLLYQKLESYKCVEKERE